MAAAIVSVQHRQRHRLAFRSRDEFPLRVAFGEAVRRRREEIGISQEELGYRAERHRNYAGKIERGASSPTLNTIAAVASALEISASELIARAEQLLSERR